MDESLYFSANDGVHGSELWRTDGSAAGTRMVLDLCAGRCHGVFDYSEIASAGGLVYFVGEDGIHGRELWRSDGTIAGTQIVMDVQPGPASSHPRWLTAVGKTLFFVATDPTAGPSLWRSLPDDGGAMLVKDIQPGSDLDEPSDLTSVANSLLFFADDGVSGLELWRSDGTESGTGLLADTRPGPGSGLTPGQPFPIDRTSTVSGDLFFFSADDGTNGTEPWVSDGTAAGTALLEDLRAGPDHSRPRNFCATPTGVFFAALSPAFNQLELWRSDGTTAGTTWVSPVGIREFCRYVGGRVLYKGFTDAEGAELWTTDGTEAGTTLVKDIAPGPEGSLTWNIGLNVGMAGTAMLFWAFDAAHGMEPWISDGTAAGTSLLADLALGLESSALSISNFSVPREVGGVTFFHALDLESGWEPWVTNGTAAGTSRIEINVQNSSSDNFPFPSIRLPNYLTELNGSLVFFANDGVHRRELWRSDGSAANTSMLVDLFEHGAFGDPLIEHSGRLYFLGPDGKPYVTDGTAPGTLLLADTAPGQSLGGSPYFTAAGDRVFFASADRLWMTGGTPASTVPLTSGTPVVFELAPASAGVTFRNGGSGLGASDGATTMELHDFETLPSLPGDLGLFAADDGATGMELWRTNLTPAGTELVLDLHPGPGGSGPQLGVRLGSDGPELLAAGAPDSGREPWISDGTGAGTMLLKDVRPGPEGSDPGAFAFASAARRGFFAADDGEHGRELWVTDGTAVGTTMLSDLRPGPASSYPADLVVTPGVVFFTADDGIHGVELWRTDGTVAGTFMVEDIAPGASHGVPDELTVLDGLLLFSAWDPVHGRELWATNGAANGTTLLQDIAAGATPASPNEFTVAGPNIYFYATDGVRGFEPWVLPRASLAATVPAAVYFYTLTPCRLLDTRAGGGLPASIPAAGHCGIPQDAQAVAINVTAVAPTAGGELVAYPANLPPPPTTVVAFSPGSTRAGNAIVQLATDGSGALGLLARFGVPGSLDVIVDVTGYFR